MRIRKRTQCRRTRPFVSQASRPFDVQSKGTWRHATLRTHKHALRTWSSDRAKHPGRSHARSTPLALYVTLGACNRRFASRSPPRYPRPLPAARATMARLPNRRWRVPKAITLWRRTQASSVRGVGSAGVKEKKVCEQPGVPLGAGRVINTPCLVGRDDVVGFNALSLTALADCSPL